MYLLCTEFLLACFVSFLKKLPPRTLLESFGGPAVVEARLYTEREPILASEFFLLRENWDSSGAVAPGPSRCKSTCAELKHTTDLFAIINNQLKFLSINID